MRWKLKYRYLKINIFFYFYESLKNFLQFFILCDTRIVFRDFFELPSFAINGSAWHLQFTHVFFLMCQSDEKDTIR